MRGDIQQGYFGKYREIVLAVGFFLVLDMTVLVLNFYISFQISASAVEINLAGRQRMLSQRMTKELLTVERDRQQMLDTVPGLEALGKTVSLFDATLNGFKEGGTVTGGDGKPASLRAVTSAAGRDILQQADGLWVPLRGLVQPLHGAGADDIDVKLSAAVGYARAHNMELLALMNRLTTDLEQSANARADLLRQVQTIGIVLALLNFGFILFKFLRRLRENDRRIEQAQGETAEILGTVHEGLFLLGRDFRIGSQYSASLERILGCPVTPGTDFREILRGQVSPATFKSACDYIELLLGDRVKESLVQELNPLTQVEVTTVVAPGRPQTRYLTMQFSRAMKDRRISHLLVTVSDVTAQIELEKALGDARKKAKAEVEVLLDLLRVNPATLRRFIDNAETTLLRVNDHLRHIDGTRDYRRTIAMIFRDVHGLKGEAAALGLEMFEDLAQQFESLLAGLRDKGAVSGTDLLALPLPLDEFLQRIVSVRELGQRLSAYQSAFPVVEDEAERTKHMEALVQRIASDSDKRVRLTTELALMGSLPDGVRHQINDIALQLLRNAVVHGIEGEIERSSLAKPPVGSIHVSLKRIDDEYEFVLRDDGRGLVPERIRAELLRRGLYSDRQLSELNDRQIIMKIFEPGFTTVDAAGRDAGHGVGMDIVKHKVKELGANLRILTRKDVYTQFSIRFAA